MSPTAKRVQLCIATHRDQVDRKTRASQKYGVDRACVRTGAHTRASMASRRRNRSRMIRIAKMRVIGTVKRAVGARRAVSPPRRPGATALVLVTDSQQMRHHPPQPIWLSTTTGAETGSSNRIRGDSFDRRAPRAARFDVTCTLQDLQTPHTASFRATGRPQVGAYGEVTSSQCPALVWPPSAPSRPIRRRQHAATPTSVALAKFQRDRPTPNWRL